MVCRLVACGTASRMQSGTKSTMRNLSRFLGLGLPVFSPYRHRRDRGAPKPRKKKQKRYDYACTVLTVHRFPFSFLCLHKYCVKSGSRLRVCFVGAGAAPGIVDQLRRWLAHLSCALTFSRPAVSASICLCWRVMIASCSCTWRCSLRNSLSSIAFTAS